MFKVSNFKVFLEQDLEIVKGIDFEISKGEIALLMGPNGAGKSSLVQGLMGNFTYTTSGSVTLDGVELQDLDVDERARKQLFLSFQQPVELPGVTQFLFLKTIIEKYRGVSLKHKEFRLELNDAMEFLSMDTQFNKREMNVGFSGGEKKKNELLQLLLLKPKVAMLDEIDSGIDVDGLRVIKKVIEYLQKECNTTFIIVSHHEFLLKELNVSKVIVIDSGKVGAIGDRKLGLEILQEGFKGKVLN